MSLNTFIGAIMKRRFTGTVIILSVEHHALTCPAAHKHVSLNIQYTYSDILMLACLHDYNTFRFRFISYFLILAYQGMHPPITRIHDIMAKTGVVNIITNVVKLFTFTLPINTHVQN